MTAPERMGVARGVPVPERGAWSYRGTSRDGGPLAEDRDTEVVWLQAGHVDSRAGTYRRLP
ncbi:hypothetical protein ACFWFZ_17670 [Streptomyces sp. NPDC060232]|uniref:hypothetical protein n=1 Tax=Streptomyces sp. NPDC060232 TaxID=3347079 RepID=UPI003665C1DD